MKRLIGLHGRARAGKDTVADILRRRADFGRMSFAGAIKDVLLILFQLDRAAFEDERKEQVIERIGRSPRYLMQTLGTEWGRKLVDEDVWIRVLERRSQTYRHLSHVVVTDVRYENEAAWVRHQGGEVWHVLRRVPPNVRVLEHSSEDGIALRPGDSVIDNDGDLAQLEERVIDALAGGARIEPIAY